MRVRITKVIAGPDVQLRPGQVVELDETTAQAYIDGGAAESLDPVTVQVDSETPKAKRKKASDDAAGSTAEQPDEKATDESAGDTPAAN